MSPPLLLAKYATVNSSPLHLCVIWQVWILEILTLVSKIQNQNLDFIYKQYSKLIPLIGKLVVGKSAPYEYLVQSIDEFVNQEELLDLIKSKNFYNASYKNLSGGIVSLHTGWKI